jgi:RNA polymerase sigma factor (sigma-70 family)
MSESAGRLPLEFPGPGSARLFADKGLARRAASGDQRAFAAIYRRHHQELYRYCRAILNDPDDAEDALQATMVKALRALPGEEREIALKPWLFRIAHNEAISLIRARKPGTALDPEQPDLRPAVEEQAATRERLRELVEDLEQLPERQRGSLVMRELSGLSFDEIGRVFSIQPAGAKQAVYEARVALQEIAEGHEMECDLVKEAISAQDRRVLRGRRIRAHLRGCPACRDFDAAIERRRSDLSALAPPLALPAALATLQAVLGGGQAGGGAAVAGAGASATVAGAGALGGGIGGGIAVKAAVAVLAAATVAGGAAGISRVVDPGGSPGPDRGRELSAPAPANVPPAAAPAERAAGSAAGSTGSEARGDGGGHDRGSGQSHGHHHGGASATPGNSQGHGQATAPGQTTTPGNSPAAPPGQTQTQPGQSQSSSSGSQASATGQAHSSAAGSQASATGQAHGGGTATAPGQTGTSPGHSGTAGDSAAYAPGQLK